MVKRDEACPSSSVLAKRSGGRGAVGVVAVRARLNPVAGSSRTDWWTSPVPRNRYRAGLRKQPSLSFCQTWFWRGVRIREPHSISARGKRSPQLRRKWCPTWSRAQRLQFWASSEGLVYLYDGYTGGGTHGPMTWPAHLSEPQPRYHPAPLDSDNLDSIIMRYLPIYQQHAEAKGWNTRIINGSL